MTDPFQKVSTVALPLHQTQESTRDPLPVNSQERIQQNDNAHALETYQTRLEDFKAYLDRKSISNLELNTKSLVFDTAKDIENQGVYHHPLDRPQP
jgi:hypothetical protein